MSIKGEFFYSKFDINIAKTILVVLSPSYHLFAGESNATMSVVLKKFKVPLAVGWKEREEGRSLLQLPFRVDLEPLLQSHMQKLTKPKKKM